MAANNLSNFLHHMRQLEARKSCDDRELLQAFVDRRDEDCFAALIRRYGPLVMRVCRSVLHSEEDAEDVFQATFLVLATKASSIRNADTLADFVCAMEDVLEVYPRPDEEKRPLVCLDEASKQLIGETVQPLPAEPGQPERFDYEYVCNG